ncbi:MAG: hypothetical protein HOV67_00945 [Kribbellaceae bacterium]|nr:hypothetical protein [Kribbellaceae bacterium]
MSKRPVVPRSFLRRAVVSAAVAVAAIGTLVTSAGRASAESIQSEWVGPYYSQLQCEVAVLLTLGDGTCWWNPNPPETTVGWWYEIS